MATGLSRSKFVTVIGAGKFSGFFPQVQYISVSEEGHYLNRASEKNGRVAYKSLLTACEILTNMKGILVTAPVSKEAIIKAGINFKGHTEFLSDFFGLKRVYMLFVHDSWKIALYTTHLPLRKALTSITSEGVLEFLSGLDREISKVFGFKPSFSLIGINPHCGEGGYCGNEEKKILQVSLKRAYSYNLCIKGIYSADSVFLKKPGKKDVYVAFTHDQGTIPAKILSRGGAVNLTLGLPIIRTSPDHGPAFDIVGKKGIRYDSMINAISLAAKLSK